MGLEAECDEAGKNGGVGLCSPRKTSDKFFYVLKDKHSFVKCAFFLRCYLSVSVLAAFKALSHRVLLASIPVLHPHPPLGDSSH